MTQLTAPPAVSQNIARAKSLVKRHELPRALDCLMNALENFAPATLSGKARYEMEVNIRQCVVNINLNPKVRKLAAEMAHRALALDPGNAEAKEIAASIR